jgi:hypothetical protein
MNWLNFFETKTKTCFIDFGRSINAQVSPNEEELFNKSYEAFEKKEILNAYEYFFQSLLNFKNGKSNENITFKRENEKLKFEIYQGTAKIVGIITKDNLHAEVVIVKKNSANVALKRYILERNYQLTYAYYFSDEKYIKLKLFHDNITMSPQKIFFPLRELALNSDFDKGHIVSEFPKIKLEDIDHLKDPDEKELKIKYDFLHIWINELNEKVLTLPSNDSAGMQSFLYLNVLLQIDYLLTPNYTIYQKLSKKLQEYFSDENTTIEAKTEEIKRYVSQLQEISYEEFKSNFYSAKYTFNQIEKTTYEEFVNFINESLLKIRWYKNNRYPQIIPTIYSYMTFYSLYNYGLNQITRKLLHTLVEVQNSNFFKALDCNVLYDEGTSSFSKRAIISKIDNIISPYQTRYKSLKPFGNKLNFSSLNAFSNSFYTQLNDLNFEEI